MQKSHCLRKCFIPKRQQQKVLYFYDGSDANNFLYAFYANSHRGEEEKGKILNCYVMRVPRNIVYASDKHHEAATYKSQLQQLASGK